ncbi:MAG: helix-turn-helix transcriptional regulator [Blautia sp.]|nr:helix-turn-helix transcriptional regulator [Blautia sp.]
MEKQVLKVNLEKGDNQDIYIDNDDVYVNHTGDTKNTIQGFIHNTCELLFVEQGAAEYTINGTKYEVKERDILIISAMDMHLCRITRTPYIRYGVYYMPKYLERLSMIRDYLDVYTTPKPEDFKKLQNLPPDVFEEFCDLIQRIYQEQVHKSDDNEEMRDAVVCVMTILLKRLLNYKKETRREGDSFSLMLKVRDYIDAHYAQDCSLEYLSEVFFIHPSTISRNFKSAFDTTVVNYLSAIRVSSAVKLLENDNASITQIAGDVGYNNVNTFIRAFTKVMGISPLQYRKKKKDYNTHYQLQMH